MNVWGSVHDVTFSDQYQCTVTVTPEEDGVYVGVRPWCV